AGGRGLSHRPLGLHAGNARLRLRDRRDGPAAAHRLGANRHCARIARGSVWRFLHRAWGHPFSTRILRHDRRGLYRHRVSVALSAKGAGLMGAVLGLILVGAFVGGFLIVSKWVDNVIAQLFLGAIMGVIIILGIACIPFGIAFAGWLLRGWA